VKFYTLRPGKEVEGPGDVLPRMEAKSHSGVWGVVGPSGLMPRGLKVVDSLPSGGQRLYGAPLRNTDVLVEIGDVCLLAPEGGLGSRKRNLPYGLKGGETGFTQLDQRNKDISSNFKKVS